jgi:hypothetical protein
MKLGPRPKGRPWTSADDAQLLTLLESDLDRPSIARKLQRTEQSIANRRSRLKHAALVEMDVPRHPQREFMQPLRAGVWVKAAALPSSPKLIKGLINRGWIEQCGTGWELSYRITDKSLAAKKAPVRV